MIGTIVRMGVIAVVSLGLSYAWRPIAPMLHAPAMNTNVNMAQINRIAEARKAAGISLEEFKAMYEGGAVVIDARTAKEFAEGHLDAPMIINIPEDRNPGEFLGKVEPLRGNRFVIYCKSETCDAATELYLFLQPQGFGEMKLFLPGWIGIEAAKLPTSTAPEFDMGAAAPPTE